MFRTALFMIGFGFAAVPANAAEPVVPTLASTALVAATATAPETIPLADAADWALATRSGERAAPPRGALLPALYVSFAALNSYDAVSTRVGLARGAVERNGAIIGVAGNSVAFFATKAAVTAGTILLSEHLWKTHRKPQAIATMVISNALMTAVAVHNAAVLQSVGR